MSFLETVSSFETHDIASVCVCFSLLYLYYWLELKETLFADITNAYSNVKKASTYNDDEQTIDVVLPYDPYSMLGPMFGCILKSFLMAFVLFILVNFIIITISASSSLKYNKKYLKYDLAKKVFNDTTDDLAEADRLAVEKEMTESENQKIAKLQDDEAELVKKLDEIKLQDIEDADKQSMILGRQLKAVRKEIREIKQTQHKRKEKERKRQQVYKISKEDFGIIYSAADGDVDEENATLEKAKVYWLFFFVNIQVVLLQVVMCFFATFAFTKLVIPHIKDIDKDPMQMMGQVEVMLYINLAIMIGGIWYSSFKTL